MISTRRAVRVTVLAAALATALTALLATAGTAAANGVPPSRDLVVTGASFSGGRLLIEGRTLSGISYLEADSTTSAAGTRADAKGNFKIQSSAFTAPDCRVVVHDFTNPSKTVTLTGCTPSVKPVPAQPAPPTAGCVISPVPVAALAVDQNSVVWFHTTGCQTASVLDWSIAAGVLPTGMSGPNYQSSADGNIIGIPTVRGTYRFTLQVTDQVGATDQENVTVTVG